MLLKTVASKNVFSVFYIHDESDISNNTSKRLRTTNRKIFIIITFCLVVLVSLELHFLCSQYFKF